MRPARPELSQALRMAGLLSLVGLPVGLLWWLIAPRRQYEVRADGELATHVYPQGFAFNAAASLIQQMTMCVAGDERESSRE